MNEITMSDLISPKNISNPAAFYAGLRAQAPLHFFTLLGTRTWITTNHEDAIVILKDPRLTKDPQKVPSPEGGPSATGESTPRWEPLAWRRDLLMVDPPDHTRLRNLVSKAFTPRMIEQLRPRIQLIADELLDAVQHRGEMEFIQDFAFPLPITVISAMLGVPTTNREQFRTWTSTILRFFVDPTQVAAAAAAEEAFVRYIKELAAEKRAHPTDDLISGLVHAEENGDMLSETELISMIWVLIVAGHETTVNLIGNGVLALLQHPEQMQLLRDNPALITSAIEELLRYTTPVSIASRRWALEDITMHGQVIREGDMVLASLMGANTDPRQFAHPEVLDITRQEQRHVAFSQGIHYCLGAPLARLEGQIAIGTVLRRLPHLRLACAPDDLVWNRNPSLRGLTALPLKF